MPEETQTITKKEKMVIGWYSFTCCEDSTILLTEMLNDHLLEWKKVVEFRHMKPLKYKNETRDLDVAFIEGAVSAETQAKEVKHIRDNARFVVAIGACACTGLPSASRNEFTPENITERIDWYMKQFNYDLKVKKLDEVIKVDDYVEGCPMDPDKFLEILTKYLDIFVEK